MHALYDLKEKLCRELESYGKQDGLSTGALDIVDKLAHTIKNLDKIIEASEYSGYYARDDRSYARRRDSMGRYTSNGYSRTGEIVDRLRGLMNDAPDDRTRQEIQNLVSRMEMM